MSSFARPLAFILFLGTVATAQVPAPGTPAPTDLDPIVVRIDSEDRLYVDGRQYHTAPSKLPSLMQLLRQQASASPKNEQGLPLLPLVIDADSQVSSGRVFEVIEWCGQRRIQLWNLGLAAPGSGRVLGLTLPQDVGVGRQPVGGLRRSLRVPLEPEAGEDAPSKLARKADRHDTEERLEQLLLDAREREAQVVLDVDPAVPFLELHSLLERCLKHQLHDLELSRSEGPISFTVRDGLVREPHPRQLRRELLHRIERIERELEELRRLVEDL